MTTFEYTSRLPLVGSRRRVRIDGDRERRDWWTIVAFPSIILFGIGLWLAAGTTLVAGLAWVIDRMRDASVGQQLVGLVVVLLLCRSIAMSTARDEEARRVHFDVR